MTVTTIAKTYFHEGAEKGKSTARSAACSRSLQAHTCSHHSAGCTMYEKPTKSDFRQLCACHASINKGASVASKSQSRARSDLCTGVINMASSTAALGNTGGPVLPLHGFNSQQQPKAVAADAAKVHSGWLAHCNGVLFYPFNHDRKGGVPERSAGVQS